MSSSEKRYRAGTLSYTTFGLIQVFGWMLRGDFCFTLMEALIPTLVPLSLKLHNATNTQIGLLVGSIPAAINFVLNPIISTASDRTRSRWGRRRPYLLFTSPFVTLFLILVGLTYVVQTASGLPMLVALYPHDRYGQFCSAGAMVSSLVLILANTGGGKFIDFFGYRYIFVWDFLFTLLATGAMLIVYMKWRKNGNRPPGVPATE